MQLVLYKSMLTVNDLIQSQDDLISHIYRAYLWSECWLTVNDLGNLDWHTVSFDEANVGQVAEAPGIYSFIINPRITNHPHRYLGYIGMTERTLRERFNEYITESNNVKGRPKVLRMLNKWQGYIDFCYLVVQDQNISEIETRLNDAFLPPFNSDFSVDTNRIINAF